MLSASQITSEVSSLKYNGALQIPIPSLSINTHIYIFVLSKTICFHYAYEICFVNWMQTLFILTCICSTLNLLKLVETSFIDSDPHHAENLIFQFRFGHKIFTDVTLNKATLSFYKTSQQKATLEKQNIALAEIIFDRIHVFTSTKKDAGLEGWVQIDMTEHVSYWVADFDNGQLETRILKLSCTNCKEKFGMKTNSDFSPFITIDLTPNS